jgi:hypothetical protein
MTGESSPLAEAPADAEPGTKAQGPRKGGARTKAASAPPVTVSEERLNAPSRQTVGMLSVLVAATLVMWAAGRAACNYHEPGESLSPRSVALEARTRTEKDVALELAQARATANFEVATQLVGGELADTLRKEQAACGGGACEARRAAAEQTFSVPAVLQRNASAAHVRVRTVGNPVGDVTRIYELERTDKGWRAMRELAADAALPPLADPAPATLRAPEGAPENAAPSGG